jgi:hypothetical protein
MPHHTSSGPLPPMIVVTAMPTAQADALHELYTVADAYLGKVDAGTATDADLVELEDAVQQVRQHIIRKKT